MWGSTLLLLWKIFHGQQEDSKEYTRVLDLSGGVGVGVSVSEMSPQIGWVNGGDSFVWRNMTSELGGRINV